MGSEIILRNIFIGILVTLLFLTGASLFTINLANNYGVELNENFTSIYSEFNESLDSSSETAYNMQNSTESSSGISELSDAIGISSTMWGVIKQPFDLLTSFTRLISTTTKTLPIPSWFVRGIITIMIILLTLVLLSILFRYDV